MARVILIVMDGCGAGAAPDAADFGDLDNPSTILHVWEAVRGFNAPHLASLGFLSACGIPNQASISPHAGWGRLQELSKGGKDSVTGHWEMAGIVTDSPFPTYSNGFPSELIARFEETIGREVLGNKPASGTEIIAELGALHLQTGKPIVYTSADSVFQIACHEEIVPLESLYGYCKAARELLVEPDNVQRVIARPFQGSAESGFTRTENRKDYPLAPPTNLCDSIGDVFGIGVVPELFTGRGFRAVKRTGNNVEHEAMLGQALETDARFIWANFEDFDMLYGHRNDPIGFAGALEKFDGTLARLLPRLYADDLLLLTADHGNDPTTPSTDHSREFVPFVMLGNRVKGGMFADLSGMTAVGKTVATHLGISPL